MTQDTQTPQDDFKSGMDAYLMDKQPGGVNLFSKEQTPQQPQWVIEESGGGWDGSEWSLVAPSGNRYALFERVDADMIIAQQQRIQALEKSLDQTARESELHKLVARHWKGEARKLGSTKATWELDPDQPLEVRIEALEAALRGRCFWHDKLPVEVDSKGQRVHIVRTIEQWEMRSEIGWERFHSTMRPDEPVPSFESIWTNGSIERCELKDSEAALLSPSEAI